jgi:hypothetical protein
VLPVKCVSCCKISCFGKILRGAVGIHSKLTCSRPYLNIGVVFLKTAKQSKAMYVAAFFSP